MSIQMTATTTPQEIGTHALRRAVHYADKAEQYTTGGPANLAANETVITTYTGLAALYADLATAAAALTAH
ncbi:hypothetical protein [Streptomyces sp. NRRL F-5702]|uniref:hypothetical protein n=1 Tax=Streptomyces sp. NRRL F-5702 TaxID=1463870 RepID=UPI0004C93194|nr:hypothetical protein [Streptomyces sp. NRRL F-5702]